MKKSLKIIIIIFVSILGLTLIDFACVKIFNRIPILAIKEDNYSHQIYNAIGYKVWKCNYDEDGSFIYLSGYKDKYNCPIKMSYTIVDEAENNCPGYADYFYEDESYKYYFNCQQEGYLEYENGKRITIKDALNNGKITIMELETKGLKIDREPKKLSNVEVTVSNNCNSKLNEIYEDESGKVYLYCLDKFNIKFNENESLSLKDSLLKNRITVPEIIEYMEFTSKYAETSKEVYTDSRSILYSNFIYSVLKCNKNDENNSIIIGSKSLNANSEYCE